MQSIIVTVFVPVDYAPGKRVPIQSSIRESLYSLIVSKVPDIAKSQMTVNVIECAVLGDACCLISVVCQPDSEVLRNEQSGKHLFIKDMVQKLMKILVSLNFFEIHLNDKEGTSYFEPRNAQ